MPGPQMILLLVLMFGGLFLMSTMAKRSQAKRTAEREKMLNQELVPGAWVQTFSGFFGRYVDTDGDVIILETPGGEETYWLAAAVKGVVEPPFEVVADEPVVEDVIPSDELEDMYEKLKEQSDDVDPDGSAGESTK